MMNKIEKLWLPKGLIQAWAKLALYIKLALTLQPFLFAILTWVLLHFVDIDQT